MTARNTGRPARVAGSILQTMPMESLQQPVVAPGVQALGERQQAMLRLLLQEKGGLTIEELVIRLEITRTAVRQHLAALERDGYVRKEGLRLTGGRPGYLYTLTPAGNELFPKQYSWFSTLVLERLRQQLGTEGLVGFMRSMSAGAAAALAPRLAGQAPDAQIAELVRIMNELGYDARALGEEGGARGLVATNCVYHHLAEAFPEVCEFDLGLLESLAGAAVRHPECMVRGGQVCRFLFERGKGKSLDPDRG